MPLLKATFFFEDDAGYGWSEGHYNTAGDRTACMDAAKTLLPIRVRLLGLGSRLTFIRVSDELVPGDSLPYPVPPGDQSPAGNHSDSHDIANTCLLVRIDGNEARARRSLYLRGFDDKYVANGRFAPDSGFTSRFNAWKNALKADGWAVKYKSLFIIPHNINTLVQDPATGRVTVTTFDAHGLVQGDGAVLTRNKGIGAPNGTFPVIGVPSPTSFVINWNRLMGFITAAGRVVKMDHALSPVNNLYVVRAGKRSSGRPLGSPRGRRSARTRS